MTRVEASMWLLLAAISSVCGLTAAQEQRQSKTEGARCQGRIKSVASGVLQVEVEGGQQWLIALKAKPADISLQASASPGFLRAGMLVQFNTVLNKRGEAQRPVSELKVVSPRDGVELGLRSEGGLDGKSLFAADEGTSKKSSAEEKLKLPFFVGGTISALKDRKFQVAAGGTTIKGEIAENCNVTLDVSDYSLARLGDSVDAAGWRYVGQQNQMFATRLTIVAEQPLISAEETRKRRVQDRQSDKKGKKLSNANSGDTPAETRPAKNESADK